MSISAALHRTYLPTLRAQTPISDFLLPGFFNHCQLLRYASTATFIPPSSTAPVPESHHKAKRRVPLSNEQQRFLDSAVSAPPPPKAALTLPNYSTFLAPRQPSRRTRRNTNLLRPDPSHREVPPTSPSHDAAYVRSRSWPLLHF